jgi:hypothetical protein
MKKYNEDSCITIKYVGVPQIQPYPFSKTYCLTQDLVCTFTRDNGEEVRIIVPVDFKTDGASIPRALWTVVGSPFLPEFITAAIVHDYCCKEDWDVQEMSDVFFELLMLSGVNTIRGTLMREAVEIYKGWF